MIPGNTRPYDLVLFAVKSYDTEAGAKQLIGTLAPDGIIMTIQNGVENEEILCRYFPREAVMGGNSRVGAELIAPGKRDAHRDRHDRIRRNGRAHHAARRAAGRNLQARRNLRRIDQRS